MNFSSSPQSPKRLSCVLVHTLLASSSFNLVFELLPNYLAIYFLFRVHPFYVARYPQCSPILYSIMVLFVDENELPFPCRPSPVKATEADELVLEMAVPIDETPSGFLRERLKSLKSGTSTSSKFTARQLTATSRQTFTASSAPPRRNNTFASIPAHNDVHNLPAVFYKTSDGTNALAVKKRRDFFYRLRKLWRKQPS